MLPLGKHPSKIFLHVLKNMYIWMFIFKICNSQKKKKQPKCPSIENRLNKFIGCPYYEILLQTLKGCL